MSTDDPIELAPGVWWVGVRLPNDSFQCHAYFLENGEHSVLLDPGSPLTVRSTLDKVARIAPIDSIAYLVCHHPDPDIAAGLPYLSDYLTRDDVQIVTEWRAKALLKHYGHRFEYYLVEEHDWRITLDQGRTLEFQLTPYLHFPGAMVSYESRSHTLFSSDLFGGFVPDVSILVSDDVDYIIDSARPFHQHYMPSRDLLTAGLSRIERRWPDIRLIAPQHGHVIPQSIVAAAFDGLKGIDCGVFTLADADIDLQHLLRISEARTRFSEALLTIMDPTGLVATLDSILDRPEGSGDCALSVDLPDEGWMTWAPGHSKPIPRAPDPAAHVIVIPGRPTAVLSIQGADGIGSDPDLVQMLTDMADSVRPIVDNYVQRNRERRRSSELRRDSLTDPLTGLGNRRALDAAVPSGAYALISVDLDHFKDVNDGFGHSSGDEVLRGVAEVLATSVRDGDGVYRIGGEEFLLVLPEAGREAAVRIATRIRTGIRALDLDDRAPLGWITASVGITVRNGAQRAEFGEALREADAALYRSKDEGRDRITIAGSDTSTMGGVVL